MAQPRNRQVTRPADKANTTPPGLEGWKICLGLLVLVVSTLVVYSPARNGEIQWDDIAHLTNPNLQDRDGLRRIWFVPGATQQYYPLLHSAFWLEYQIFEYQDPDNPSPEYKDPNYHWTPPYHWINIIQHAISACLLWIVLRKIRLPGAYLGALLFAVHPINVESVAWITEQKNTLSMIFYLAAAWCYLEYDERREDDGLGDAWGWYFSALLLFVLGLATKSVIATLPAALLVVFWWRRGRLSLKRDVLPLAPFFFLGFAYGVYTAWYESSPMGIGAHGPEFEIPFLRRFLIANRVVWFYLYKLLVPFNLTFFYPRWTIASGPIEWWWWLFVVATIAFIGVLIWLARRWRGPLAAFLFFGGSLVPVMGFLNVYPFRFSFVADHFQYLAAIGIYALVAGIFATWISRRHETAQRVGFSVAAVVVVTLAFLAWKQSALFGGTAIAMYEETVRRNPNCFICYDNWGAEILKKYGKTRNPDTLREAIPYFQKAIELKPRYVEALKDLATTYTNLHDNKTAIPLLLRCLDIEKANVRVWSQLGNAYYATQQYAQAKDAFEEAVIRSKDRGHDQAILHGYLGDCWQALGNLDRAIEEYKLTLEIQKAPQFHNALGGAYAQALMPSDALEQFQAAMQLNPNDWRSRFNAGKALTDLGRFDEATMEFHIAAKLDPKNIETRLRLALACHLAGRADEAKNLAIAARKLARNRGTAQEAESVERLLTPILGPPASDSGVPPATGAESK